MGYYWNTLSGVYFHKKDNYYTTNQALAPNKTLVTTLYSLHQFVLLGSMQRDFHCNGPKDIDEMSDYNEIIVVHSHMDYCRAICGNQNTL